MYMKDIRMAVRVTAKEKDKIQSKARKCGLSTTEYVKQRALGYEPRGIPPDALFLCLEKLGELFDIHLIFPAFLARELIQHERIGAKTEFMPFEFVTDRAAFNRSSVRRNKLKSQRFFARRLCQLLWAR